MTASTRNRGGLSRRSLADLEQVQVVLADLQDILPLTLRQLYYQLVAKGLIGNNKAEYGKLSRLLVKARLAGLVPWSAIEDRVRSLLNSAGWSSAEDYVKEETEKFLVGYRRDLLQGQDVALEVWVEKDALGQVLYGVALDYCVSVVVARGFSSVSFLNDCRERVLSSLREDGRRTVLLYFGDLDPSGHEMLPSMLETLQVEMGLGNLVVGRRCALTPEQVDEFQLPRDATAVKRTDTRARKYLAEFGELAVELDALPPRELQGLVRRSIEAELDMDLFEQQRQIQEEDRELIERRRDRVLRALEDEQ